MEKPYYDRNGKEIPEAAFENEPDYSVPMTPQSEAELNADVERLLALLGGAAESIPGKRSN